MPDTTEGRILVERVEERLDQYERNRTQREALIIEELRTLAQLVREQNGRISYLERCEAANLERWKGHDKTHTTERGVFGALIAVGSAIAGWIGFNS